MFGVDFMAVKTVPGSNALPHGAPVADYVNAIKTVEALEKPDRRSRSRPRRHEGRHRRSPAVFRESGRQGVRRYRRGPDGRTAPGGRHHGQVQGIGSRLPTKTMT